MAQSRKEQLTRTSFRPIKLKLKFCVSLESLRQAMYPKYSQFSSFRLFFFDGL